MFPIIVNYLRNEGYSILRTNPGSQRGPDIIAEKSHRVIVIQMKGDSAALKTDWDTGLGQLLEIMNDDSADYAMVISKRYENYAKKFPKYVKNKLQLTFLLIEDDGRVTRI